METPIEIIMVDEKNQKANIIALENNQVVIQNITLNRVEKWNLEDLKQCVKFI